MRNRRRKKDTPVPLIPILLTLAAAAVTLNAALRNIDVIGQAGEQAAIASAVLTMPDAGLDLILERFRSLVLGEEGTAPDAAYQHPWPPPQVMDQNPPGLMPETRDDEQEGVQGRAPPRIPARYSAPVISEDFSGYDDGNWVKWRGAFILNETSHSDEDILSILETPWGAVLGDTSEPQVLIVHTHATESFESHDRDAYDIRNTWRSTDNSINITAVGAEVARVLEENGVTALHDTTQHDYPSYNGSYNRAANTIEDYLRQYPSIKIVLDIHRDAMPRGDAIVKPVAVVEGEKAAQIMLISSSDNGTVGVPEWRENLRFAALLHDYMESRYPGLARPVYLCYRKYNMDLTTGSLLMEVGSNANTLEEALHSARMAGQALSDLIWDLTQYDE
ncbi:MAG: stage II sporulation protein P [Oscillospiraceae bacterium]|nr:stage II sporulation protein P [Oscillospiraceae bacterium]